jgi:hypothetical protein
VVAWGDKVGIERRRSIRLVVSCPTNQINPPFLRPPSPEAPFYCLALKPNDVSMIDILNSFLGEDRKQKEAFSQQKTEMHVSGCCMLH